MATLVSPDTALPADAGPRYFPATADRPWGRPRGARHAIGHHERTGQFVIDTRDEAPDQFTDASATDWSALSWKQVGRPYSVEKWSRARTRHEAATAEQTDWPQILALYDVLERVSPGPVVTLNRAVAVARAHGPLAGLAVLAELDGDERMAENHRLESVRAHLLELAGDHAAAHACYVKAAGMTASLPEQRYLHGRANRLT